MFSVVIQSLIVWFEIKIFETMVTYVNTKVNK